MSPGGKISTAPRPLCAAIAALIPAAFCIAWPGSSGTTRYGGRVRSTVLDMRDATLRKSSVAEQVFTITNPARPREWSRGARLEVPIPAPDPRLNRGPSGDLNRAGSEATCPTELDLQRAHGEGR